MVTITSTSKAGKIREVKALIADRDDAVYRVLTLMYDLQTANEQNAESTSESNGQGFSASHAEFGSILAKVIKTKGVLTERQMIYGRRIAGHYARQVVEGGHLK